jgi:hypothetical protein
VAEARRAAERAVEVAGGRGATLLQERAAAAGARVDAAPPAVTGAAVTSRAPSSANLPER